MARQDENELLNEASTQSFAKYDYPEGYVPSAWVKRQPPENIVPDSIWLPDFLDNFGKELFPLLWNGHEIYARSPHEISEDHQRIIHWLRIMRMDYLGSLDGRITPETKKSQKLDLINFIGFMNSLYAAAIFQSPHEEHIAFLRKQDAIKATVEKILKKEIEPFLITERGEKSEIRESWWREKGIRFVFEYGHSRNENHAIYISKALAEREEKKPKDICCPEGIWSREAMFRLAEKEIGRNCGNEKAIYLAQRLIEALSKNPAIEVFKICSHSGEKEKVDRDFLRSKRAGLYFCMGWIPYSGGTSFDTQNQDGRYIFVNKVHFENFLADKPISEITISGVGRANSNESYTPAYLDLMLKAVKALNLTPDARASKDLITEWLTKNWPSDLEGKSDRLIESMATLMRRPEDKKGGNHSMK